MTIRGARRSHTDDVLRATVEFSPRGFQSHGAFLSSVWSVLRSATINYPMAFIVSRRESGAKVRIRRRYPSRGFSTDLRRISNLADRWIGEWFWKDNSRGIRREWRLCADQSQSSEFNDCIFWIYRARLINITSSLSEPRNYKKFYGDRMILIIVGRLIKCYYDDYYVSRTVISTLVIIINSLRSSESEQCHRYCAHANNSAKDRSVINMTSVVWIN